MFFKMFKTVIFTDSVKTILILLILSSALVMPAIGALDDADLNKIRLIVNDVVKKEITDSETRMKEYIDLKIDGVVDILSLLKHRSFRTEGFDKAVHASALHQERTANRRKSFIFRLG